MFGLDSPLGLFPPGIDPAKLYNPLMEMSDPRGMHPDHAHPTPYLKKKGKCDDDNDNARVNAAANYADQHREPQTERDGT